MRKASICEKFSVSYLHHGGTHGIFCYSSLRCPQHFAHYWIRSGNCSAKSDESWNPTTLEETYILEEDPSPVWPGGPPPWWENDYAGDIYENLKKSENEFPDIGFESPNLYDRPIRVNYICQVADTLSMTNATKFLAVRLLDGYMDKHSIISSRLKLMALACLSISCKFS